MHSCMSPKLRHFIQTGQWHGHPFWATLYKHYTLLQVDSGIPISVNCFPILPSLVGSWHEEDTSLLGLSATKATSLEWNWHKWRSWQVTTLNVSYNKRGNLHAKYVPLLRWVPQHTVKVGLWLALKSQGNLNHLYTHPSFYYIFEVEWSWSGWGLRCGLGSWMKGMGW